MIPRNAEQMLREVAQGYPVVGITGPRQSGKSTLAQYVFQDKPFVSLEPLDVRASANTDPMRMVNEIT